MQDAKPETTAIRTALVECWDALADMRSYLDRETPDHPISDAELRDYLREQIDDAIKSARSALNDCQR